MRWNLLSAVLAAFLTGSVLWGACASCQDLLAARAADSNCCDPAGKCKTTAPSEPAHKHCKSPAPALQQMAKGEADLSAKLPSALAPAHGLCSIPAAPNPALAVRVSESPPEYSPPDLFRLYSAFLI